MRAHVRTLIAEADALREVHAAARAAAAAAEPEPTPEPRVAAVVDTSDRAALERAALRGYAARAAGGKR